MIYYDVSEARPQSHLPKNVIAYGKPFRELEALTGADFIIVPEAGDYEKAIALKSDGKPLFEIAKQLNMKIPNIIKLLNDPKTAIVKWCLAGALLVQRKSGMDFVASFGPRLNNEICDMLIAPKQHQRIILVTGIFNKKGVLLTVNGKSTNTKYKQYLGAKEALPLKGVHIAFEPNDNCILDWIKTKEQHLLNYKHDAIQWIVSPVYFPPDIPPLDDPLQLMQKVTDARLSICNMPGWGIGKTNLLYNYVKRCYNTVNNPTLLQLLTYATAWETATQCKGIGLTLIEKARKYVGLQDGEYLCVSQNNVTVQRA